MFLFKCDGKTIMKDIKYSKEELLDIILRIIYPNKLERDKLDREILLQYFRLFGDCIDYCSKEEDFLSCMTELRIELWDIVDDIINSDVY